MASYFAWSNDYIDKLYEEQGAADWPHFIVFTDVSARDQFAMELQKLQQQDLRVNKLPEERWMWFSVGPVGMKKILRMVGCCAGATLLFPGAR